VRILFIHSVPDLYGASRSLLRMASRLACEGHHVFTVLPVECPLAAKLRAAGIVVIVDHGLAYISRQEIRKWRSVVYFPVRTLLSCVRTGRLVRALRPDLIHSNTALILPGGIVGKVSGIPHICHVREIFSEFGHAWLIYQWFLYLFSDSILCNSYAAAAQFHPWIRARKVRILHNGYPASEFVPVPPDRVQRFRTRYGLNGHRVIGLVGRIRAGRKGQDVFLKAAALLQPKFPDVKFLCIGSPFPGNEGDLRRFQELAAQKGLQEAAFCTGDVEDIQAAYAALDVSIQASVLPESFGGVVIESMAMGKPVIATAIGGSLELIEDGLSGLLVEPNHPGALASAIELVLNDEALRDRLGKNGRARFLERFEFEAFYAKLLEEYSVVQAASASRRPPTSLRRRTV